MSTQQSSCQQESWIIKKQTLLNENSHISISLPLKISDQIRYLRLQGGLLITVNCLGVKEWKLTVHGSMIMKKCSMFKKIVKLKVKKKMMFQNQTRNYYPIQIVITMLQGLIQRNGQNMITFMINPQEIQTELYKQWILENITRFYHQLLVRIKQSLVFSKITTLQL